MSCSGAVCPAKHISDYIHVWVDICLVRTDVPVPTYHKVPPNQWFTRFVLALPRSIPLQFSLDRDRIDAPVEHLLTTT